ncbi:MAG: hypothetical protein JRJ39_03370 [Deltaproteobacteria bacterium]|nr:hypothetical protein [Deltaproteobacteria bacterium]MBW1812732.1 hypothetical protein [Deltaproteobacteria bacterium]MBW1847545.1 hypothetical protein [Deltaproteobacteria bacterium]MBW2179804.1 hypothetical protein [Deltaproteobacteria bacterium]MBW2364517.1 hypothetical protein [Deltaproteobacteria bacterium]
MDVKYEVIADQEKNRLYITFGDLPLPDDQREMIVTEIWEKAQILKAGWGCIVNYSHVSTEDDTEIALLHISDAMQVFEDLEMGQLVRVITPQQLDGFREIKMGIENLAYYEAIEVDTLEKANAILDGKS